MIMVNFVNYLGLLKILYKDNNKTEEGGKETGEEEGKEMNQLGSVATLLYSTL